ncbi:MAG: hypothetical protein QRY16_12570 [Enterobacterales bacterium endosymbiont of Blomia tropicalis]|uniref:hypothetical protein n=1 Tax=Mixta mediterraneensis TaxID=2758443 RepID=UPI0025A7FFBF|nr:hypothetical protein [Mixta mediterraneensis]MDL4914590.1 hypothetical protein [Mixta mediterraneensis]
MIRNRNFLVLCGCLLCLAWAGNVRASAAPVAERIIQNGFPTQPGALAEMTQALFTEYKANDNPLSLVFYAYGMLRQADGFMTTNDFIRASEYAKTGFFYLDEAVDLHEDNLRVRYLRARVDAWLAADSGRCVVTLKDTALMLSNTSAFNAGLVDHINGMRYRALLSCKQQQQAEALLAHIKKQNAGAAVALLSGSAPEWDMNEVNQVLLPLVKGK